MSSKTVAEAKKRNAKKRKTETKIADTSLPTQTLFPPTPKEVKEFGLIIKFLEALSDCYKQSKHILFYKTLAEKTTNKHAEGIRRHIHIFNKFCERNLTAIQNKDESKFVAKNIEYSAKAFIDIKNILSSEKDKEIKSAIWEHLTALCYYAMKKLESTETKSEGGTETKETKVDSSVPSVSSQLLGSLKDKESHKGSEEDDFVSGLIDKMSNGLSNEQMADPSSLLMTMMTNGMLSDIMGDAESKMSSGKLNINKLLGSVQGLIGKLSTEDTEEGVDSKTIDSLNKKVEEIMKNQ